MAETAVLVRSLFAADERRVDGREKVSGRTQYTADKVRAGALWAAFAGSPFAHARIRRIDVSAARALPGVRAVLTGAELGERRAGRQIFDWPLLARDVVRFVGDRVAAVAAETREAAEAAAAAIEVDYEELPAILDAEDALAPGAPILHPDWDRYHYTAFASKPRPERTHGNVYGRATLEHGGDPDAVFADAARVFEQRFRTPRQHCGYLEPHATLVWIDAAGVVHVETTHKMPFSLRDQLAHVLELPRERIVIEAAALGGDFGGKGFALNEYPLYYLAKATGRPVRHVQTYADELTLGTVRHATTIDLKTAVDADGRFLAHRARVLFDGGAYAAPKSLPWLLPGYGFGSIPYHVPNVRLELAAVYTNTVPSAHMRGPGEVQTVFAWEQHVDTIARALGIDPLEMRLRNAIVDGQPAVNGDRVPRPGAREVLATLQRESRAVATPRAPGRGRGIALVCGRDAGGKTAVALRLTADGAILATVGVPEQGAGAHTVVQRVVAAALDVDPGRIAVVRANTADALPDPGAGASRVTHIVGRAAQIAGETLRAALVARCGVEPTERGFAEIARRACAGGPVEIAGEFDATGPDAPPDYADSAYAVEVEVDRETGEIRVVDALLVVDVGEIINPVAHRGQVNGGFVFGLGCALYEDLGVDESGRVRTVNLGDYKLPTIRDTAPFQVVALRGKDGHGPFGAKMIGEVGNVGVAPAIANAVYDAVGVRITDLPLTAEKVFAALQAAR